MKIIDYGDTYSTRYPTKNTRLIELTAAAIILTLPALVLFILAL